MSTKTKLPIHCCYNKLSDPDKLKPFPGNPRAHPQAQIDDLARVIHATGWRRAITVSKRSGYVVRGHGALEAAKILKCQVPVEFQNFGSEDEERAHVVYDNRSGELSAWNDAELAMLIKDMPNIDMTGFSAEQFLESAPESAPESPQPNGEAPRRKFAVKVGDVWAVGRSRLICGDKRASDILAAIAKEFPEMKLSILE